MSKNYKTEDQKKQSKTVIALVVIVLVLIFGWYITNLPVSNKKTEANQQVANPVENKRNEVTVSGVLKLKYIKSNLFKEHRIEKNIDFEGKKTMDVVFTSDKFSLTVSTQSVKPDYEFKTRMNTFPESKAKPEVLTGLSNPNFAFVPELEIRNQYRIIDTQSRVGDTYLKQIVLYPIYGRSDMILNEVYANATEYVDNTKIVDFLKNITIE